MLLYETVTQFAGRARCSYGTHHTIIIIIIIIISHTISHITFVGTYRALYIISERFNKINYMYFHSNARRCDGLCEFCRAALRHYTSIYQRKLIEKCTSLVYYSQFIQKRFHFHVYVRFGSHRQVWNRITTRRRRTSVQYTFSNGFDIFREHLMYIIWKV